MNDGKAGTLLENAASHSIARGVWAYRSMLPIENSESIVSLGEGGTPLFDAPGLSDLLGLPSLYLKNETANPTWSYKDRANTVAISFAQQLGFKKVVAISTGNHGASVAAYSGAAGLRCLVLCHEEVSPTLVRLINLYGGEAIVGGDRETTLKGLVEQGDWFPAVTVAPYRDVCSPYGVEGFKTIAYEIFEQLGRVLPDCVFLPVGSGDGCYGIWKGFCQLVSLGLGQTAPRIYACQAEGCNPLVRSFRAGSREVEPMDEGQTMALSIRERWSSPLALRAVYDSQGEAVDCSEMEIEDMWKSMGRTGLFVEPASAVALACARKLAKDGRIKAQEKTICVLTGAGTKWPEFLFARLPSPADTGFRKSSGIPRIRKLA